MAPKGSGREIIVEGTPSGWKAIEKTYLSGAYAGKTYIRFQNDKHRNVLSVKQAIKLDAEDSGLDADLIIAEYERKKEEAKEAAQKEKEAAGYLKGEKRQEAVDTFRAKFGKLDGATVCNLPGWRGESKRLENCGQISARYFDQDGRQYALVMDIEALFGMKIQAGEAIPDIERARATLKTDETGKVINVARKENVVEQLSRGEPTDKPRKRKRQRIVAEADYQKMDGLAVLPLGGAASPANASAATCKGLATAEAEVGRIRELLQQRRFGAEVALVYVSPAPSTLSAEAASAWGPISGTYFRLSEDYDGRPCYQKVVLTGGALGQLSCRSCYIFWSAARACWKIGRFDDKYAGVAVCSEDWASPTEPRASWSLYAPVPESVPAAVADADSQSAAALPPAATPAVCDTGEAAGEPKPPESGVASTVGSPVANDTPARTEDPAAAEAPAQISQAQADPAREEDKPDIGLGPLWKLWSWAQVLKRRKNGDDLKEPPSHWPKGLVVARGLWAEWLPEGWGQASHVTEFGNTKTLYVSPEGKTVDRRYDVEKCIGRKLPEISPGDRAPDWPDWLPLDWYIGYKENLAGGSGKLRKSYVSPEGEKFWSRDHVEARVRGEPPPLRL